MWSSTTTSLPIVPGPGCVQGSDNTIAVCTGPNLTRIDADMGDMSDTVTSAGLIGATLRGGAGDDVMTGSDGNDALFGDAGIDTISGGLGDDQIDGGDGDDTLRGQEGHDVMRGGDGVDQIEGDDGNDQIDGGAGADTLNGGFGSDWVDYTSSGVFVVVDLLDAGRDDGEPGEGDNVVTDIENILGGSGPDTLRGGGGPNRLSGGAGADIIDGLSGTDTIEGGDGSDTIQAKDGATDVISCGGGTDTLTRDVQDIVVEDCEVVDGGGGFVTSLEEALATGGVVASPASIVGTRRGISVDGKGVFRLRVKCPKKSKTKVCKGSLRLKTKGKAKKYKVRRGKAKWVRLKLSKKGKKIVFQVRKVKARVISKSGRGKKTKTKSATITLKFNKNVRFT